EPLGGERGMRSVHEFKIDRPRTVIAGQSFAGPVWDSAGSASVGQGDRQSAVDERRGDLDQSRMLHGLEHLTFVDVDEAEFAVAERAASVDDRGGAGRMWGGADGSGGAG